MLVDKFFKKRHINNVQYSDIDVATPTFMQGLSDIDLEDNKLKISAVYACVDLLSNSISKLPFFVVDTKTNKHLDKLKISNIFQIRPNINMTMSVYHKLMETWRLLYGNAYAIITRDDGGEIECLTPIQPSRVDVSVKNGLVKYLINTDSVTNTLLGDEIIHLKGFSYDGIKGVSVLEHAQIAIKTSLYQEKYLTSFYEKGDRPSGVLSYTSDLSNKKTVDGRNLKDIAKEEWRKVHSGPDNAFGIAVLDNGMTYKEIPQMSQKDADFVLSKELGIADIARFFGVPLYKIKAGKETYSSNEQNSIEYIVGTLSPIVNMYEQEYSSKFLMDNQLIKGFRIKANLNAELRGDTAARGSWYKTMREIGAYSVNDILKYEDMESVTGGDSRLASLNYVPLEKFEELSIKRNAVKEVTGV